MTRSLSAVLALAVFIAAAPAARAGLTRPDLELAGGSTFHATGQPGGGGLSLALSPVWPLTDHAKFGVTVFADDIGTDVVRLRDPNDGSDLGSVAQSHRWSWGAAWRGELDVLERGPWTLGAAGSWGAWRIEDDRRGLTSAAATSVGFVLGADVRRHVLGRSSIGLAVRYHRPFADRRVAYTRVDRYSSAALEWRWVPGGTR